MIQLLTLEGLNRTYRYATTRLTYDGHLYTYGLQTTDYTEELAEPGGSPDPQGYNFVIYDSVLAQDTAALALLPQATATFSVLREVDGSYVKTDVATGLVRTPSYGSVVEAITFSVKPDVLLSTYTVPDAKQVVGEETFVLYEGFTAGDDAVDMSVYGRSYPLVFGTPGYLEDAAVESTIRVPIGSGTVTVPLSESAGGTPGLMVAFDSASAPTGAETHDLMIAGHEVEATAVYVRNTTQNSGWLGCAVKTGSDLLGQTYSYVSLPTPSDLSKASTDPGVFSPLEGGTLGNDYVVNWSYKGVGMEGMNGAGSPAGLFVALCSLSGLPSNEVRVKTALNRFSSWKLAGYIDEKVSAIEWITAHLLPILPISLALDAKEGLIPLVYPFDATSADSVHAYDTANPGVDRASAVVWQDSSDVVNDLTLKYALDLDSNEYSRKLTLTGDPTVTPSDFVYLSDELASSVTRFGLRSLVMESDIVYSKATALHILTWLAQTYSSVRREVTITVDNDRFIPNTGDIIQLTDSTVGFSSTACVVLAVARNSILTTDIRLRSIT